MSDQPFADGVWPLLCAEAWEPLPLPRRRKAPPPPGTTGSSGVPMYRATLMSEVETDPRQNLGGRPVDGLIGVDNDDYDEKTGAATIARTTERLGASLPPTYRSSARDAPSGIRWYRAPKGLDWTDLPDVEIIHHRYRYAVLPPSVHPSGRPYRWYRPDGRVADGPPNHDDLPWLPEPWVRYLSRPVRSRTFDLLDDDAMSAAVEALATGKPCGPVADTIKCHRTATADGIHTATVKAVANLLYLGRVERHRGVPEALDAVRDQFASAIRHGRDHARQRRARGEWRGIVAWSASRAASFGGQRVGACMCASVLADFLNFPKVFTP